MTVYAYSLDRVTWTGRFASRTEALHAALERAVREAIPPESVFVGQRVSPNLRAYGLAREVITAMADRVREDQGDIADSYLRHVNEKQVNDLNGALESTIVDWLVRNDLMPTFDRIEAVGEHAIPAQASHN